MFLKTLQKLALLLLISLTASLTACSGNLIPPMAGIVEERIEYHGKKIGGRIDFVGMQRPGAPWFGYNSWPEGGDRNVLSLFISKLDVSLREKVHVTRSHNFCSYGVCLFPWRLGNHSQFLFRYQQPVNDSLGLLSTLSGNNKVSDNMIMKPWKATTFWEQPPVYEISDSKMVRFTLSQIKRYSDADYFLLITIKFLGWDLFKEAKIVLLTIIYNRDGKKIYSKICAVSVDSATSLEKGYLYDCTMKLIETQGEQINKDLSFLLTADDAPAPTLEDLHKRLQQPGTIDDDVKYLKGFQGK